MGCKPDDIALKTFFLGPQAENIDQVADLFSHILYRWAHYRRSLFPEDGSSISPRDQTTHAFEDRRKRVAKHLGKLMDAFEDEIPKFSPRYLGHMFSEISLPALYASFLALLHNPNNISEEASKVGLRMEREAIRALNAMIGYSRAGRGHFTSCGTIANMEASLRARDHQLRLRSRSHAVRKPARALAVFFPKHAHYCWEKIANTLGYRSEQVYWVELDSSGHMRLDDLDNKLSLAVSRHQSPSFVVSVFGTTEFGFCDPVDEIATLLTSKRWAPFKIWHHVDAAYGGFFACLKNQRQSRLAPPIRRALRGLSQAHSVTVDPHKLGYIPYACGAFLCRDVASYAMADVASPYLAKSASHSALWTFEGSRSAAGALSTVITSQSLGFNAQGFGRILELTLEAKDLMIKALRRIPHLHILPSQDLNILGFVIARPGDSNRQVSRRSLALYRKFSPQNASARYFVTKTKLDRERYSAVLKTFVERWQGQSSFDLDIIRICLMNPFLTSRESKTAFIEDFANELKRALRST